MLLFRVRGVVTGNLRRRDLQLEAHLGSFQVKTRHRRAAIRT
jgi:hypothetical protein